MPRSPSRRRCSTRGSARRSSRPTRSAGTACARCSPSCRRTSSSSGGPGLRQAPPAMTEPDATPPPPAIEFRSASVQIGDALLLGDVDFAVAPGEQVAVIGASGAGKTTLLRLCAGVLWPSRGHVLVLGRATGGLGSGALCRLRKQ